MHITLSLRGLLVAAGLVVFVMMAWSSDLFQSTAEFCQQADDGTILVVSYRGDEKPVLPEFASADDIQQFADTMKISTICGIEWYRPAEDSGMYYWSKYRFRDGELTTKIRDQYLCVPDALPSC